MKAAARSTRFSARLLGLLAALGLAMAPLGQAKAEELRYKVEAAFLYNFLNYITWPSYDSPQGMKEATICLMEGDPIRPYLDYVRERRQDERRLNIRSLGVGADTAGCQILYVSSETLAANPEEITRLSKPGLLVVGSAPSLLRSGGMIQLVQEDQHMAIEIRADQLNKAGFKASSRLLEIAKLVQ